MRSAWGDDNASPATFDFESYARQGNGGAYRKDSSSDEDEKEGNKLKIQIDMSGYGY